MFLITQCNANIHLKWRISKHKHSYSLSNKKPTFIPVNDLLKVVRPATVVFVDDAPNV